MHVVVPIKRYANAKTRLAAVLAPGERARLARCLAQTLLVELAAAHTVSSVQVVSGEPTLAQFCRPLGFSFLDDSQLAPGLNAAVEYGLAAARRAGIERLAVLHADLPLFRASAFDAMARAYLATARPAARIVTDSRGDGTNLIFVETDAGLPCLYGPGSAERHAAAARALGMAVQSVRCPRLSVDCDGPEDLRHVAFAERGDAFSAVGAA